MITNLQRGSVSVNHLIDITTPRSPVDYKQDVQILILSFGICILIVILAFYIFRIWQLVNEACQNKYKEWVWDTVSLSCSQGIGIYILGGMCSFTAMFMSCMYSVEFTTHQNNISTVLIFIFDMIANIALLCIGIFPTSFHKSWQSKIHLLCGGIFFIITTITNLLWSFYTCHNYSYPSINVAKHLSWITLVILLLFGGCQIIIFCQCCQCLQTDIKNSDCLEEKTEDKCKHCRENEENCENCNRRRKNEETCEQCKRRRMYCGLNIASLILEFSTIALLIITSFLQTIIANRLIPKFGQSSANTNEVNPYC